MNNISIRFNMSARQNDHSTRGGALLSMQIISANDVVPVCVVDNRTEKKFSLELLAHE